MFCQYSPFLCILYTTLLNYTIQIFGWAQTWSIKKTWIRIFNVSLIKWHVSSQESFLKWASDMVGYSCHVISGSDFILLGHHQIKWLCLCNYIRLHAQCRQEACLACATLYPPHLHNMWLISLFICWRINGWMSGTEHCFSAFWFLSKFTWSHLYMNFSILMFLLYFIVPSYSGCIIGLLI